jgi:hypothetical protein
MMNPFIAIFDKPERKDVPDGDSDFERKVRSGRGANRAKIKAQQANIDAESITHPHILVNG